MLTHTTDEIKSELAIAKQILCYECSSKRVHIQTYTIHMQKSNGKVRENQMHVRLLLLTVDNAVAVLIKQYKQTNQPRNNKQSYRHRDYILVSTIHVAIDANSPIDAKGD